MKKCIFYRIPPTPPPPIEYKIIDIELSVRDVYSPFYCC